MITSFIFNLFILVFRPVSADIPKQYESILEDSKYYKNQNCYLDILRINTVYGQLESSILGELNQASRFCSNLENISECHKIYGNALGYFLDSLENIINQYSNNILPCPHLRKYREILSENKMDFEKKVMERLDEISSRYQGYKINQYILAFQISIEKEFSSKKQINCRREHDLLVKSYEQINIKDFKKFKNSGDYFLLDKLVMNFIKLRVRQNFLGQYCSNISDSYLLGKYFSIYSDFIDEFNNLSLRQMKSKICTCLRHFNDEKTLEQCKEYNVSDQLFYWLSSLAKLQKKNSLNSNLFEGNLKYFYIRNEEDQKEFKRIVTFKTLDVSDPQVIPDVFYLKSTGEGDGSYYIMINGDSEQYLSLAQFSNGYGFISVSVPNLKSKFFVHKNLDGKFYIQSVSRPELYLGYTYANDSERKQYIMAVLTDKNQKDFLLELHFININDYKFVCPGMIGGYVKKVEVDNFLQKHNNDGGCNLM